MANNLKELRLAFLLTPTELASRIGTDAAQVERLENPERELDEEWIDAVMRGLGVPRSAVIDPKADVRAIAVEARAPKGSAASVCPIGARYAVLAMAAKLGGPKLALSLKEDALMTAVQNVIGYVDRGDQPSEQERLTRLAQALQITVLTILQSRGVEPEPQLLQSIDKSLHGATQLVHSFSSMLTVRPSGDN